MGLRQFIVDLDYPAWVWVMIAIYLALPLFVYVLLPIFMGNVSTKRRIIIFVLGDLGHSPRMCYHARSFANKGWDVDLCGYLEEQPPMDLIDNENISIHAIPVIKNTGNLPFIVFGVSKVLKQIVGIAQLLWSLRGAKYILVQNPPSIPTLIVAVWFKILTRTRFIIDWHNLGYSILALKLGDSHPFVIISKIYETILSRFSDMNLTVSKKMMKFLNKEFGVKANTIVVLYDKAAKQFQPINKEQKLEIIKQHPDIYDGFDIKKDKILISSTSFTPDEDFNLLIEAFKLYDKQENVPKLRVIITGKGPLKEDFLNKVSQADFKKINVKTAWLTAEDYPKILATADLGISLHTSSSGIDLPMKVVDMFGCGVPVIALDFPALPELLDDQVNGKRVESGNDIYEALLFTFLDEEFYNTIKQGALDKSKERWDSNWKSKFGDLLL